MSLQANLYGTHRAVNHGMPGHGGFDASLLFGIGDQFMESLFDSSYWLPTVRDVLDELSDVDMYEDFPIFPSAVSSTLSSFSSTVSESTIATSLFTIAEEDIHLAPVALAPVSVLAPVQAPAPVPAFPGVGAVGPAVGGGGLPYSIIRMLSEDPTEMPWSAAMLYASFDEV